MTPRVLLTVVMVALAAGCGELQELIPPPQDGGLFTVGDHYPRAKAAPGHQQHLSLKGEKQVLCRDCHAIDDAGFRAPPGDLCLECHKDQGKQHHPLDAGIDLTCLTCHPFMAKQLPQRFEKWMCFDCHQKPQGDGDAGVPAITVHRSECQQCHRPHEAPFTQSADCTTCHEVKLSHGAKGDTLADKCMNCHEHHTAAAPASGMCVTCHTTDKVPAKARVEPKALFEKGHVGCGSCHVAHTFDKDVVKPCVRCHDTMKVMGASEHDSCRECHRPHLARAAPKDCKACHKDEVVKHPKSKDGKLCLGCHYMHDEKQPAGKVARGCLECHDEAPFTNAVVHGERVQCDDCHEPHDAKPTSLRECKSCHDTRYVEVARLKPQKDPKGHRECKSCHDQLPHGLASQKPCLSCHEKSKPPQAGHTECKKCHESHSGVAFKACTDCHAVKKLLGLHAEEKHQECEKCHAPHVPEPGFGPANCRSCHKLLPQADHTPPPQRCTGCHLFIDARQVRDAGR
ncbi:MAG: hypothetical protein JNJ54_20210 [Myxococcaceae bacterium]|nr:hypothetical protein [Myxococcaceae bacterium]